MWSVRPLLLYDATVLALCCMIRKHTQAVQSPARVQVHKQKVSYLPKIMVMIPKIETLNAPCLSTLDL